MGCEVVHHHNIAALERGNQALLDVGSKHLSGHGALEHHWGGQFVVTQGGHEGDCLPVSKRDAANQSDAPRGPPPEPYHIGADRSFINEHQSSGVKHALLPDPASARAGHVCSLSFRRLQAFF